MTQKLQMTEALFRRLTAMLSTAPLRALITLNEYELNPLVFRIMRAKATDHLPAEQLIDEVIIYVLNGCRLLDLPLESRARLQELLSTSRASSNYNRRFSERIAKKRACTGGIRSRRASRSRVLNERRVAPVAEVQRYRATGG